MFEIARASARTRFATDNTSFRDDAGGNEEHSSDWATRLILRDSGRARMSTTHVSATQGEQMRRCPIDIEEFDASDRDVSQASTLPPACYTSPEFFEFEKDAIFFRDWLCIGRADQVPSPGDYLAVTLVDEPLVMLRDNDGEIVVLSAVCRHRAGAGRGGRGQLRSQPALPVPLVDLWPRRPAHRRAAHARLRGLHARTTSACRG